MKQWCWGYNHNNANANENSIITTKSNHKNKHSTINHQCHQTACVRGKTTRIQSVGIMTMYNVHSWVEQEKMW